MIFDPLLNRIHGVGEVPTPGIDNSRQHEVSRREAGDLLEPIGDRSRVLRGAWPVLGTAVAHEGYPDVKLGDMLEAVGMASTEPGSDASAYPTMHASAQTDVVPRLSDDSMLDGIAYAAADMKTIGTEQPTADRNIFDEVYGEEPLPPASAAEPQPDGRPAGQVIDMFTERAEATEADPYVPTIVQIHADSERAVRRRSIATGDLAANTNVGSFPDHVRSIGDVHSRQADARQAVRAAYEMVDNGRVA